MYTQIIQSPKSGPNVSKHFLQRCFQEILHSDFELCALKVIKNSNTIIYAMYYITLIFKDTHHTHTHTYMRVQIAYQLYKEKMNHITHDEDAPRKCLISRHSSDVLCENQYTKRKLKRELRFLTCRAGHEATCVISDARKN